MKKTRQPRQKRSIQTKQQIIKAGLKLFAQKGIHGTNTKEIVNQAGVSIGSFYAYFSDKKVLLLEILEDYLDQVYSAIWKPLPRVSLENPDRDVITTIIENVFLAYEIAPEFHRQTHALRYSDPDVNRIYNRERNREIEQIKFVLESNTNYSNLDELNTSAILIHNTVESAVHTYMFLGPPMKRAALIYQLSIVIASFYDYLVQSDQTKSGTI